MKKLTTKLLDIIKALAEKQQAGESTGDLHQEAKEVLQEINPKLKTTR